MNLLTKGDFAKLTGVSAPAISKALRKDSSGNSRLETFQGTSKIDVGTGIFEMEKVDSTKLRVIMSYTHCEHCGEPWGNHGTACKKSNFLETKQTGYIIHHSISRPCCSACGMVIVVQQGATDLSDISEAEFFTEPSFRTAGAQSASATIPGITNPGGSYGYKVVVYDGAETTTLDPNYYDNAGTKTAVTAGYWTIQRIFRDRIGKTLIAYGQQEFADKAAAITALGKEAFTEKIPLPFTLFRCSLVVQQGWCPGCMNCGASFGNRG